MKAIIKLLVILLFFVILFVLAGLFLPRNARLETGISVEAPVGLVFDQVNVLKNWKNWSPWQRMDSTMEISYQEITSGVGAVFTWRSETSGGGSLEIVESDSLRQIVCEFTFNDQESAKINWVFNETGNSTQINLSLISENMTYLERYFMFLFKKQMINTLHDGLTNIKMVCQELKYDRVSEIDEVLVPAYAAILISDSAPINEFSF